MSRIKVGEPSQKNSLSLSLKNLLNKYTPPPPYGFRKRGGKKVTQGGTINNARDLGKTR